MNTALVKKIMGKNYIGPEELSSISLPLNIPQLLKWSKKVPKITYSLNFLRKVRQNYVLILGVPEDKNGNKLTINRMRLFLGWNPQKAEPCFYNQDWYLKERFAKDKTLDFKWYLVKKTVKKGTRGKTPKDILKTLPRQEKLPSAVLTTFTFFAYYFLTRGEVLWKHDFIWCSDRDGNNDRIYVGRYSDPNKVNKNGFNIHRHLSIRSCYGVAPQIIDVK